ncbi:MAG TPA: FecR domain-containing protein [Methylomirabilota bacterium]|nr:FecR domain-containing protein [Methylomirabilota bacterium]
MSVRGVIGVLAVLGLVGGVSGSALAQEQPGIGVVSTLIGEATVARGTTTQPLALKMRDDVFMQDRISTKERSLVHVLLGGKALLTVRELSVVTITEDGGRATVDLQSGKVGLAVVRQRMKPGEIIEIRTPHAVAAVRGTVLVVEIVPGAENQASAASTDVHLLHGKLDVSLASNPTAPPIQLESLQSVTASNLALGRVRPLTPESVAAVTANLKMNRPSLPGPSDKFVAAISEKQRALAVATASTLVGGGRNKVRITGFAANVGATQKGKVADAPPDRDPLGIVSDAGDGRATPVSLGAGPVIGTASTVGLVGISAVGGGSAMSLQGPVSGPGSGGLGNGLAPVLPRLRLLPTLQ